MGLIAKEIIQMEENRILGYKNARELSHDELVYVAGGTAKLTLQGTHSGTYRSPGGDIETDQIWD